MRRSSIRRLARLAALCVVAAASAACRPSGAESPPPGATDLRRAAPSAVHRETRRFTLAREPRGNLVRGWSHAEWTAELGERTAWAIDDEATLAFELFDASDQQLLLRAAAHPDARGQHVVVSVNGVEVGTFDPPPMHLEYRFVLPASALRAGRNVLALRHSVLVPPRGRRDRRSFAVSYSGMLMGPLCVPLRANGIPPRPGLHSRPKSPPPRLVGPAELVWRVQLPPEAELRVAMTPLSKTPARWQASIREDGDWTAVAGGTVERPLVGRGGFDETVDLGPWSGQTVDLRLALHPEACSATVAQAALEAFVVASNRTAARAD